MQLSRRVRRATATVILTSATVLGIAQGAHAVDWGPLTGSWESKTRGTHWGRAYEYNGMLYNEVNVRDDLADGNPMFSNFKYRFYAFSTAVGQWTWTSWSPINRTEAENTTASDSYYVAKNPNGNIFQAENVLYINLNNMPDVHWKAFYSNVDY
jgi:hypothetical protein